MQAASTADGPDRGGARALLRIVRGQQPVELQHALGERPAPLPEQAERGGQAQPLAQAGGVLLRPGARRTPARPACSGRPPPAGRATRPAWARPALARAASATVRKYARCRRRAASCSPVSASRARAYSRTVCSIRNPGGLARGDLQQALVGQVGQMLQRQGRIGFRADRSRGRGVERPGEYPEAGEQAPRPGGSSAWLQSSAARSVCCRRGRSRGPPVSSARRDRSSGSSARGGVQPDPGRGQLDGQRQAVQRGADLADGGQLVRVRGEVRAHGPGPRDEQLDRLAVGRAVPVPPARAGEAEAPGRCAPRTAAAGSGWWPAAGAPGATASIRASSWVSSSKCSRLSTTSSSSRSCSASAR